jgi:hypothetical protein
MDHQAWGGTAGVAALAGFAALVLPQDAWAQSLTLNLGGALGYLCEEGDFAHLTTKVSLDYAFTETATFSPFVAYALSLEDGSAIYNDTHNELVGGAMLSVSF